MSDKVMYLDANAARQQGQRPQDAEMEPIEPSSLPVVEPYLPPRLGEGIADSIERMRRRAERQENPIPLPWPSLAAQLGRGIWPGTFTMITGTTGSGKSAFGVQMAMHAARQQVPVAYVALELDRLGMHARTLSLAARDDHGKDAPKWSEIYLGEDIRALERAGEYAGTMTDLPFHLDVGEPSGWDYRNLLSIARGMRKEYGDKPFLLVLDFLQLVDDGNDDRELRLRMKSAAYLGRAIAKDEKLNAAVVFLSATSRENYGTLEGEDSDDRAAKSKGRARFVLGRDNPARLVGTSKEAGDIEYAADNVLVVAREPWPGDAPPPTGTKVWIAIAKARARARATTGWVELRFDGSCFGEAPTSLPERGRI